jgi:hypothetical protein
MLPRIQELRRVPAPAPEPQALACDGKSVWLSSRVTKEIHVLDAAEWTVRRKYPAPGTTYGFTVIGAELRAVVGEEDDDRYLRRFLPEKGFVQGRARLPEDTGSYLGYGRGQLYLTQWYKQRLLFIDDAARVSKVLDVPHQICGCTAIDGIVHLLTTDDEESYDYFITRVDVDALPPSFVDIALVPFHARSLAWDGDRFWTNHREADEVVRFEIPGYSPSMVEREAAWKK